MTMSLFIKDTFRSNESFDSCDTTSSCTRSFAEPIKEEYHILGEKLRIPKFDDILPRPRLDDMIDRSLSQFGATLISGRSGTGKTALAAGFAKNWRKTAWYSLESPDVDWNVFSRYFSASLNKIIDSKKVASPSRIGQPSKGDIAQFLANIFSQINAQSDKEPLLIVLDDLHRIFDADWFGEFFNLLLYSLRENTHLLLLCRSRPPNPLWRLRSKQMLNVIDEKLLAFNSAETTELFEQIGLPAKTARYAHTESFGRIAKVVQIAAHSRTMNSPAKI